MLVRRSTLSLFAILTLGQGLAFADPSPAATTKCLGQLLVVSGLDGVPGVELGGDTTVVLAHLNEDGHSRYFAYSSLGYFTTEKPWPKRAVSFSVTLPEGAKHFAWQLSGGRAASQSSGTGAAKADIVIDHFVPLDAPALALLRRIVQAKLPKTLSLYQADRELAAKKHMHSSVPLGYVESYTYCGEVTGDTAITSLVKSERAKFDTLKAKPVEFAHYEVVRRGDHPEWRMCANAKDCATVSGPCGWTDVIAQRARPAYASWATARAEQLNCDSPDDQDTVRASCDAGVCRDLTANTSAAWTACSTDAECDVVVPCDEPLSVNKKTLSSPGFQRWSWLEAVDNWDRCTMATGKESPKNLHARCAAGKCQIAK